MTRESNGSAARAYHVGTKHPHGNLMDRRHVYDPGRNPLPFKIYRDLDPEPLTLSELQLDVPALHAISSSPAETLAVPDIEALTRVLKFSAGITKTLRFPWGELPFRAAACTGALYHIELYLVSGDIEGLDAGVYHFDPRGPALTLLRSGDYRQVLAGATADEPHVSSAPAVIVYTDVFWRNAVKYQAREYRHAFWDSGTIVANTLAVTNALGLSSSVVTGFVDDTVNRLLGLDPNREVSLAMAPIGRHNEPKLGPPPEVEEIAYRSVPVSDFEIDFPAIREVHQASSFKSHAEVVEWRELAATFEGQRDDGAPNMVALDDVAQLPTDSIESVITRRGSTRRFSQTPIEYADLSALLATSTRGFRSDHMRDHGPSLNRAYLIVNAVDGLSSGTYAFHAESRGLEALRRGDFRDEAGQLGLGQALAADAAVNIYFMADLDQVLDVYGDRGYRVAQLEASITAGRMYLAAYALGLGATGLTFFDDAVTDFFSPHATGKSVMFLIAVGRPLRRSRPAT